MYPGSTKRGLLGFDFNLLLRRVKAGGAPFGIGRLP